MSAYGDFATLTLLKKCAILHSYPCTRQVDIFADRVADAAITRN